MTEPVPLPLTLTPGQASAEAMVRRLLDSPEAACGVLTGYAGTGKTTLLKVLAQEHGDPLVITPTGKASVRVREATGLPAMTMHKWMYRASEDQKTGEPKWTKKPLELLELPSNGLVVVDEASMVNESLWMDVWVMCNHVGLRVLLVGDKFQLPPVTRKESGEWSTFSALDLQTEYRADLTEVVRQAMGSPIVRASMKVRQSEDAAGEALMELPDVPRSKLVEAFLKMSPDRSLIAWKNATRHALNLEVRAALGYHPEVLATGEPLLVLQNNYGLDRFNGEVLGFEGWRRPPDEPEAVRDRYKNVSSMVSFGLAQVDGGREAIVAPEEVFGRTAGIGEMVLGRNGRQHAFGHWGYEDKALVPPYLNANLGYCLTAHKSQGSEWKDVLVLIEEGRGPSTYDARRWLYTAITRARENLLLCWA